MTDTFTHLLWELKLTAGRFPVGYNSNGGLGTPGLLALYGTYCSLQKQIPPTYSVLVSRIQQSMVDPA